MFWSLNISIKMFLEVEVDDRQEFLRALETDVDAILLDKKRILPAAAYLEGEYGTSGIFVGVPVILGAKGVEKVIDLELTPEEKAGFDHSVEAVNELVEAMTNL